MRRHPLRVALLLLPTLAALAGPATLALPQDPIAIVWRKPLSNLYEVAVSPDGKRVLTAGRDGFVRCLDAVGQECWSYHAPGLDRLAISREGKLALAYAANRYLRRTVLFFNQAGQRAGTLECEEPIRTAIVSPGGEFAAVATGKRVLFCALSSEGLRRRSIPFEGEPVQLHFGPGDTVFAASRGPDSVQLVKSSGRVIWKYQVSGTGGFSISASGDGQWLGVAGERTGELVEVSLFEATGSRKWTATRPGRGPRIRLSAAGEALLLSYEHKSAHEFASQFERRLAYFTRTIEPSWTKGGAFTAPLFVSVDREGDWVVALDAQRQVGVPRLRLYGRGGERRWIHESQSPVLIACSSSQGSHILVYHADQTLELLEVREP